MQSDWLRTFWPTCQEQEFFQIWDLCRNTANSINFRYRTNSVKINDRIFQYIQKTLFLAHFPNFGGSFFLENPPLSHTSYGFLASCQNLEKTNDTISRKRPDRQKGGQALFYRTLPATAAGPINGGEHLLSTLRVYMFIDFTVIKNNVLF